MEAVREREIGRHAASEEGMVEGRQADGKASLLRTSRILTPSSLRRNLSWRKMSTCTRPIISTTRLSDMCSRRSTRLVLSMPPSTVVETTCPAVSLYHNWLVG